MNFSAIPVRSLVLYRRSLATIASVAVALLMTAPVSAAGPPALVKDIDLAGDSDPRQLTNVGGVVYFSATDGLKGRELWMSDGSEDGTVLVKNIRPGSQGSDPKSLTKVGGLLYFTANDGAHGRELWMSDGTRAGTRMVKDIRVGSAASAPGSLVSYAGRAYFSANDGTDGTELWRSDGSVAGTKLVKDIDRHGSSRPYQLVVANGLLFFGANRNPDPSKGFPYPATLWKTDGTRSGTREVTDDWRLANPQRSIRVGGHLYVHSVGPCCVRVDQLSRTDGTPGGTKVLKSGLEASQLADLKGTLLFNGEDSDSSESEFWKSNGTRAGTVMLKDLAPGENDGEPDSSDPLHITPVGDRAFFTANDEQLWITDGTRPGTDRILDEHCAGSLAALGDALYYAGGTVVDDDCDSELWTSDGSPLGTSLVSDINPTDGSGPYQLTAVGASLYFSADDGTHGRELWRYVP
jgi:ELWxxDGT repeat protein